MWYKAQQGRDIFILLQNVQTMYGTHPTTYSEHTGDLSCEESGCSMNLTTINATKAKKEWN